MHEKKRKIKDYLAEEDQESDGRIQTPYAEEWSERDDRY
jgi:hypothetical protein